MGGIISLPQYSPELLRMDDLIVDEPVIGLINGVNNHFDTISPYVSGTLSIYVDGRKLTILDYQESINLHGFDLIINPSDDQRLNKPLRDTEEIRVSYIKSGSTTRSCIVNL